MSNTDTIFWLNEEMFNGKVKSGFYYRSKIAIEINDIQTRFGLKVVGIHLTDEPKKSKKGRPKKNTKKSNGLADLFKNIDASRI